MTKVNELIKDSVWIPGILYQKSDPIISVLLIAQHNTEVNNFQKCIMSILAQTLKEIELIIVDDSENNEVVALIEEIMKQDGRVNCIRHIKNVRLNAVSLFEAYIKSKAQIITFSFVHDFYFANALEKLWGELNESRTAIVYGVALVGSQIHNNFSDIKKDAKPLSHLLAYNFITNSTVLIKKEVFENIGFLDPHIIFAQVCDWDFWLRAREFYELKAVDISVSEKINNSSEQNSLLLWNMNEWGCCSERKERLNLERYGDYDVIIEPENKSCNFKQAYSIALEMFKGLFWLKKFNEKKIGRILVIVATDITASYTLSFENLPSHLNQFIRVGIMSCMPYDQMIGASAVIFVRDLGVFSTSYHLEFCRQFNIPHYYYADDNFPVLSKEIQGYSALDDEFFRETLKSFDGVLLSSQALVQYFEKKNIHSNLLYYPPIQQSIKSLDYVPQNNFSGIKIATFGGRFRHKKLCETILPAIVKLSRSISIHLIIGGADSDYLKNYESANLKISNYSANLSYRTFLQHFINQKIDILIHPLGETQNIYYKTLNALINANILNAVAIVPDIPPYSNLPNDFEVCMRCIDNSNSWYEAMEKIVNNPVYAEQIKKNCTKYCNLHFLGQQNALIIENILNKHLLLAPLIECRMVKVFDSLRQIKEKNIEIQMQQLNINKVLPILTKDVFVYALKIFFLNFLRRITRFSKRICLLKVSKSNLMRS